MGSRAFWAVVFGFLGGVFLRSFLLLGWGFVLFLLCVATGSIALGSIDRPRLKTGILLGIGFVACAFGIARMQIAGVQGDPKLIDDLGKTVFVQGFVFQEPDARQTETLVSIQATSLVSGSSSSSIKGGVLAELPAHSRVSYGDVVEIRGKLVLPQPFQTDTDREFLYPQYLAAQGITYQLRYAQIVSITGNVGEPLQALAIAIKETFLRGLGNVMPDPEAALAGGITVGDKRSIGPDLSKDFQRDSLIHMVVLSGYNITVVLQAAAKLLSRMPRFIGFGGSGAIVIFFVFVAGGASSALRAALMALIAVAARATHRVYVGERVLAFVSVCMVVWNPWTLCFDPSFQLSALATLGLILFTPLFENWFSTIPDVLGAREILSATCATQLMVLPLLLYQNGTLSIVALPANLLSLLPVPSAMFFSLIAGVGGVVFGPAAVVLAFPAYALLWYVISVAHMFASLPFAAVSIPPFSAPWLFISYGALVVLLWIYKRRRPTPEVSVAY
ncbi:MAG: ComEC/Rec2 family competence protein [Candidatus Pacebacteria bacterium]|nr:ComEC/Rec2 family competence protein [Candidatus Paceibacterota bacterium]